MAKKKKDVQEYITVQEAAGIAAVSVVTIRNWCVDFFIGKKIGGQWKVKTSELNKVLSGELHYGR